MLRIDHIAKQYRDQPVLRDIDLLVETRLQDSAEIARAHTRFLSQVYAALGEQKVDVLIDYPSRQERPPIFEVARQQGVVL